MKKNKALIIILFLVIIIAVVGGAYVILNQTRVPVTESVSEVKLPALADTNGDLFTVIKYNNGCYDYMIGDWHAGGCHSDYASAKENMMQHYNLRNRKTSQDFEVVTE